MAKKILICVIFVIFVIPMVHATCNLTLDKSSYFLEETPTVTANCDGNEEKNNAYDILWIYDNGTLLENDSGTTPSVASTNFFESFTIPSTFNTSLDLNVSMEGTNLEGSDNASVQQATSNALLIENIQVTSRILMGRSAAVHFDLKDENDKAINNGQCLIDILDDNLIPLAGSTETKTTVSGEGIFSTTIDADTFTEGTSVSFKIHCSCGLNNTGLACWDEDGSEVINSQGTATFSFDIGTWLNVNTVTDKSEYSERQEVFICANVTNVDSTSRVPMEIYHQIRCSAGDDNNEDTDRVLVTSDDGEPDERGIDFNTTQMQCKRFVIPEPKMLQGKSSQCYASTSVWVLDENREEIQSYFTTSPSFNITIDELHLWVDWEQVNGDTYNSIINLSADKYSDYNGIGTGNIDLLLTHNHEHSIKAEDQSSYQPVDFEDFLMMRDIKNITILNLTGSVISHELEFNDDGTINIEIKNVDMSSSGYYNVTLEFESFEERGVLANENQSFYLDNLSQSNEGQELALQGIENKTGLFHLSVDCPDTGESKSNIECTITAFLEDPATVQKETDFECYINDDGVKVSQVNFNQMITQSEYNAVQSFFLPGSLDSGRQYVLQCKASYYNLGSRTDSFSDVFYLTDNPSNLVRDEAEVTFKSIFGKLVQRIQSVSEGFGRLNPLIKFSIIFIIVLIIVGISILVAERRKKQTRF